MRKAVLMLLAVATLAASIAFVRTEEPGGGGTSYAPVAAEEDLQATMARMKAAKPAVMRRQRDLLEQRYDLADRPVQGVTMSGGKAVQEPLDCRFVHPLSFRDG